MVKLSGVEMYNGTPFSIHPSAQGEHFTGSSKTVLYVDEFRFNY